MAISVTLTLGTIEGESLVVEKAIDVLSWSWGMTQSASAHVSTGAGTGSADVSDLTITKYVDKSTPNLLKSCFGGDDHKTAVLSVWKVAGQGQKVEMVKLSMSDTVYISSISTGAQGDSDRFVETLSLNFATVKLEYTTQKKDNTKGATTGTGDLKIAQKFGS